MPNVSSVYPIVPIIHLKNSIFLCYEGISKLNPFNLVKDTDTRNRTIVRKRQISRGSTRFTFIVYFNRTA